MKHGKLQFLFIGGPGRSGTSYVAKQLGTHPQIVSFPDIELKLLTEKSGLLDLHHSLVEHYSPNRASVAIQQFRRMNHGLLVGHYGQPALSSIIDSACWTEIVESFLGAFTDRGHCCEQSHQGFCFHAARFLHELAHLSRDLKRGEHAPQMFLEKTPHSLLSASFIENIVPNSRYLHIMRDPRAIAFSLREMRWGPDDLNTCCAWVQSYCRTFQSLLERQRPGRPVIEQLYIEEIARSPEACAQWLTGRLGLSPQDKIFEGASIGVLDRWQASCANDAIELLSRELGKTAAELGYEADEIGGRSKAASLSSILA